MYHGILIVHRYQYNRINIRMKHNCVWFSETIKLERLAVWKNFTMKNHLRYKKNYIQSCDPNTLESAYVSHFLLHVDKFYLLVSLYFNQVSLFMIIFVKLTRLRNCNSNWFYISLIKLMYFVYTELYFFLHLQIKNEFCLTLLNFFVKHGFVLLQEIFTTFPLSVKEFTYFNENSFILTIC